jgi:hypothetical protein
MFKYTTDIISLVSRSTIGYFKSVVSVSFRLPVIAVLPEEGSHIWMVRNVADFGKLITDDTEKWGKVMKFADIKPE